MIDELEDDTFFIISTYCAVWLRPDQVKLRENILDRLYSHKIIKFIFLFILLSLPFLVKVADDDTWWHLVIGREK